MLTGRGLLGCEGRTLGFEPSGCPLIASSQILTVLLLLLSLCSHSHAGEEPQTDLLFRRVYIIGDRDSIMSDPDGVKSITAYTEDIYVADAEEVVVADPRPVPAPCGHKVGQHYLNRLVERFKVLALNNCRKGVSKVTCPSNYLPSPYSKIFLNLEYTHVPGKIVKLELNIYHRQPSGSLLTATLLEADRNWYNELYIELRERAYCK